MTRAHALHAAAHTGVGDIQRGVSANAQKRHENMPDFTLIWPPADVEGFAKVCRIALTQSLYAPSAVAHNFSTFGGRACRYEHGTWAVQSRALQS